MQSKRIPILEAKMTKISYKKLFLIFSFPVIFFITNANTSFAQTLPVASENQKAAIEMIKGTHIENEIRALDDENHQRRTLDEISGSFMTNVLTLSAIGKLETVLLQSSLRQTLPEGTKSIWTDINLNYLRLNTSTQTIDSLYSDGFAALVGFDIWRGGGLFIDFGQKDVRQVQNKALIKNIGLGIYGAGALGKLNLRTALSLGIENYFVERKFEIADHSYLQKSEFNTVSAQGAAEIELGLGLINPFVGANAGAVNFGEIREKGTEAALIFDGATYSRVETIAGFNIRKSGKFSFGLKLYGGYLFDGAGKRFKVKTFNSDKILLIENDECRAFLGGADITMELKVSQRLSLYLKGHAKRIHYDYGHGLEDYSGSFGINYAFRNIPPPNDEMPDFQEAPKNNDLPIDNLDFNDADESGAGLFFELTEQELAHAAFMQSQMGKTAAAKITENDNAVIVCKLDNGASFVQGGAILTPEAIISLSNLAAVSSGGKAKLILDWGQFSGNAVEDPELQKERVRAVVEELAKNGVPPSRIIFVGLNPSSPN
jgi:hypothetical protein